MQNLHRISCHWIRITSVVANSYGAFLFSFCWYVIPADPHLQIHHCNLVFEVTTFFSFIFLQINIYFCIFLKICWFRCFLQSLLLTVYHLFIMFLLPCQQFDMQLLLFFILLLSLHFSFFFYSYKKKSISLLFIVFISFISFLLLQFPNMEFGYISLWMSPRSLFFFHINILWFLCAIFFFFEFFDFYNAFRIVWRNSL